MMWTGRDLTIDAMLADPVIGALMRADRVEARQLEASLRAAARRLETARSAARMPQAALIEARRRPSCGAVCGW